MSFANELRDFLASYTAITEMGDRRKTREADREYRDAMLDLQRQRVDMERERLDSRGAGDDPRLALRREELELRRAEFERRITEAERERNAARFGAIADNFAAQDAAAVGQAPASSGVGGFNVDDFWAADDDDLAFARGGMVPRPAYNRGGMVDSEPDPELVQRGSELTGIPAFVPGQPYPPQAVPLGTQPTPVPQAVPLGTQPTPVPQAMPAGPSPATTPAPETERPEINPEASRIVVSRAAEAADAAARSFSVDIERPRAAVGEGSEAPETDIVNNRGGLSMEEYEEVLRMVDPNGAMPAHLQSAAVLAEGYRFFQEQGDLPRAETFARRILITQKAMSQTLGALSLQALENGDLQSACRLFNDACNRFPSGHEVEVRPDERRGLIYRVSNNGEVVDQGRLNTEQFWELATGVSNGSAFLREVAQFASEERPRARTPEDSLTAAIDARLEAESAIEALQLLMDGNVRGQELRDAQQRAQQMSEAFTTARDAAIRAGNRRTDVDAAFTQALRTRVPTVPDEMLDDPQPGFFRRLFGGGSDGSGEGAIPAAPTAPQATPQVTPQGNPPGDGELARPTNQAEFNALPSGTRFIAPDGSVRVKP